MTSANGHVGGVVALRWAARAWSVVTILLVLGFIVGEGVYLSAPVEWLGFLLFPVGICAGMVVAWRREGLGGLVTVVSLGIFYLIYFSSAGTWPPGVGWLAFAAPGFLFLLSWLLSGKLRVSKGVAR